MHFVQVFLKIWPKLKFNAINAGVSSHLLWQITITNDCKGLIISFEFFVSEIFIPILGEIFAR
jgi:hypothetical protein